MSIKILTLNLFNRPSRWELRRHLIVDELGRLQPDLVAFQEVALPSNNALWLAAQLKGYEVVVVCPKVGRRGMTEGLAVLSKAAVLHSECLDLGSQGRVAQLLELETNGQKMVFVNGHFYWHLLNTQARMKQVRLLLERLDVYAGSLPVVVCGDYNSTPGTAAIQLMKTRFRSAFADRHNREPIYTFPTPLSTWQKGVRKGMLRMGNLLVSGSLEPWKDTVDYIFVSPEMEVRTCQVVMHRPARHDPSLYPSDHLGLLAELEWKAGLA